MVTLTTPITVPNLTRARLSRPDIDEDASVLTLRAEVGGAGGRIYGVYTLTIANGQAQGVRATAAPAGWGDVVQVFTRTTADLPGIATAYTDAVSAFLAGGGALAARLRALETYLQSVGLLPAGSVS
jgi:hypothetical protein